jgi:hypothetical protein
MAQLVYLLAASHSGSTLLAMLLGAHPEVCSVGELKWTSMGEVDRYRCSCGTLIRQCTFWRGVQDGLAHRHIDFDMADPRTDLRAGTTRYEQRLLQPLHRGPVVEWFRDAALALSPGWRGRLAEHQSRNRALAEVVLQQAGKRVLVDSSKMALRLRYLLRTPGLDVRVIRVVRDGRAVSLTYTNEAQYADSQQPTLRGGGSGRPDVRRIPISAAAHEWRRSNEEAMAVLSTIDRSRWTEVHYEDLCADPQRVLARLSAFMNVDPHRVRLDFRNVEHHVVGNGMRLDSTSDIKLDERWKTDLTAEDIHTFGAVAGSLNRQFGYV